MIWAIMKVIVSILTLIFCAVVFVALNPKMREQIRSANPLKSESRDVVAVVEGSFAGANLAFYKVKTNEGVIVEIYNKNQNPPQLKQTLDLKGLKDGILDVKNSPTRMVLTDFDGDGDTELLVPVFDTEMRPQLYVFKFNGQSQRFDQVSP